MGYTSAVFFIDNRMIATDDIVTEASLAAYFRSVQQFVLNYLAYAARHPSWLKPPIGIIFAASSDKTCLITENITEDTIKLYLEPKYYNPMGSNSPNRTNFLSDGILKLSQAINSKKLRIGENETIVTVVITLCDAIISDELDDSVENSLIAASIERFSHSVSLVTQINLQFLCVQLKEDHISHIQKQLKIAEKVYCKQQIATDLLPTKFSLLINLSPYYDDQLRKLIGIFRPKADVLLRFPNHDVDLDYYIALHIIPPTTFAADLLSIADRLELISAVDRLGINPYIIHGAGYIVRPQQIRQDSSQQNYLLFNCLCSVMAKRNICLILASERQLGCKEYWVLIPPAKDNHMINEMTLLQVISREDVIPTPQLLPVTSIDCCSNDNVVEAEAYFDDIIQNVGVAPQFNPYTFSSGKLQLLRSSVRKSFESSQVQPATVSKLPTRVQQIEMDWDSNPNRAGDKSIAASSSTICNTRQAIGRTGKRSLSLEPKQGTGPKAAMVVDNEELDNDDEDLFSLPATKRKPTTRKHIPRKKN